jgi:hypothetical protein
MPFSVIVTNFAGLVLRPTSPPAAEKASAPYPHYIDPEYATSATAYPMAYPLDHSHYEPA